MTIAAGVVKELRYKREASWAVLPATNSAQFLRRVSSEFNLDKQTYQSQELRKDRQVAGFGHGIASIPGAYSGELSPGTYVDFFRAAMRQAFQSAPTTGTIASLVISSTQPQYTRGAGSYITDGFKIGDVGSWTLMTGQGTNNNNRNFMISALTSTGMSGFNLDGTDVVGGFTMTSASNFTLRGKKTWVPSTGQLDDSFAFEHWFSDVNLSELYYGVKVNEMGIAIPPTGIATLNMQLMGRYGTRGTAEYFVTSSASGETTTGLCVAVNGVILAGTNAIGSVTGAQINVHQNLAMEGVVGSNLYPGITPGRFLADGQVTAFLESGVLRDLFWDETEVSIAMAVTVTDSGTSDFVAFTLPRVKLGGADKDDGEKNIVQTIPFQALLNVAGGTAASSQLTTMSVQDSQAP